MNKLLNTLVLACFTFAATSAFAADKSNTEDAKDGLIQDQSTDYKKMDTNADGMISKKEYMKHHDHAYGKMKQTNGSVSLKDMYSGMTESAETGGLEGKAVGGASRANTGNNY